MVTKFKQSLEIEIANQRTANMKHWHYVKEDFYLHLFIYLCIYLFGVGVSVQKHKFLPYPSHQLPVEQLWSSAAKFIYHCLVK